MIEITIFLVLLAVGYGAGTWNETRHYRSITRREQEYAKLPVLTVKQYPADRPVLESRLVIGSCVVSIDYFKRIAAALRSLIGGKVAVYETLIDRARREAVLRMKEKAAGSDVIVNLRVDTSAIGGETGKQQGVTSIEVFAYGTALKFGA